MDTTLFVVTFIFATVIFIGVWYLNKKLKKQSDEIVHLKKENAELTIGYTSKD